MFGITQGRLTPSNELQKFPDNWKKEFSIAAELRLSFIELLVEREHNPDNPIWNPGELISVMDKNRMIPYTVVNDYIINHNMLANRNQVYEVLISMQELRGKKLILPLMEQSELTLDNSVSFVDLLNEFSEYAERANIEILLESLLPAMDIKAVLDDCHRNIHIVFDTGNRATLSKNMRREVEILKPYIKHVHIKDKNAANENVLLGRGLVDFYEIFRALKGYTESFAFETTRGTHPIKTAKYNIDFIKFHANEAGCQL